MNIKKYIFSLGVRLRNESYNNKLIALKNSEFVSSDKIKEIQKEKLEKLLPFVYKNSDFYKSRFDCINYKGNEDVFGFLKTIPITNKKDLINFNDEVHTIKKFKFKKLFFSETSGSSGEPLTFYKDEQWDSSNRASIARGMSWYGVEPYEYNGYFWGYSFSWTKKIKTFFLDWLLNRFRLFSYNEKDIDKFVKKASKAKYLHGYSSMIYEVAKKINNAGIKLDNLKFVKGTSEKIYEHYQDTAKAAFGCKIVSEYGSAETGIIAFECPNGMMHINEETCIVEVIDNKIIVTNLEAYSFPVIRYALGDYVQLSDQPCSCGRPHKVINEILGRVGSSIYGINEEVFPSLTIYYIFKNLALEKGLNLNYKAEQYKKGQLIIKIDRKLDDKESDLLLKVANVYFNKSMSIKIIDDTVIHDKTKKLKDFESFI
ncbi:phenylacetate--CoA ligase family protein [Vibrio metschnikovii]|nr:phenylacetate--CoA ligase family protein [Vibrio metschnikovii]EKO3711583.1 phenylacetate--CoA ligase family protein [Vibrio metschnikovii]